MQGSYNGSRYDIGLFNCVDAVLGTGSFDCIRWGTDKSSHQYNTCFVRQVKHMLESNYLHRTQYSGEFHCRMYICFNHNLNKKNTINTTKNLHYRNQYFTNGILIQDYDY